MSGVRPGSVSDTSPDMLAVHARLVATLSPAERARRMRDLTLGACVAALAGLRSRHPKATDQELLLRLAVLRLGAPIVERVYGWRAPADGA